ncbi:MAG: pseudouridine synthase [Bacteroidetes bacterium]|nr:pseudouridine synthase [Bacteroidota bacterium]
MKHQYFIINKPYQTLSQFSSVAGKKTLKDFFSLQKNIYPVGRLDEDSEGLLLLTNDPLINERLLNPIYAHAREYLVQVEGNISPVALLQLEKGISIRVNGQPYTTKPCNVTQLKEMPDIWERIPPIRERQNIPTSWIKMILHEGKNRQVRKMTAAAGFPVLRLIRIRIADIEIGKLQPGEIKELSKNTINKKLFGIRGE